MFPPSPQDAVGIYALRFTLIIASAFFQEVAELLELLAVFLMEQ